MRGQTCLQTHYAESESAYKALKAELQRMFGSQDIDLAKPAPEGSKLRALYDAWCEQRDKTLDAWLQTV